MVQKVKKGREPSKKLRENHLIVYWKDGEPWFSSPDNGKNDNDHAWTYYNWSGGGESSFLKQLEKRGYDISTLKFSVRLKR